MKTSNRRSPKSATKPNKEPKLSRAPTRLPIDRPEEWRIGYCSENTARYDAQKVIEWE